MTFITDSRRTWSMNDLRSARLGVALGGGAARGFAHIGFLDQLDRGGLRPDCLSGASIGAFIGAAYAGGDWQGFVESTLSLQWLDLLSLMDPVFPRCGLMDGDRILEFLAGFLTVANLEECDPPLAVNATDAATGEEVVFTSGPIIPAVRASIALPGMFTPCRIGNRLLLDGALINPLPVSLCKRMNAEIVVAVDLNAHVLEADVCPDDQPWSGRDAQGNTRAAQLSGVGHWVEGHWSPGKRDGGPRAEQDSKGGAPSRMLNLFAVVINSMYIMQRTVNLLRLEKEPPDFLIQPELREFKLLDFFKGPACSEAGARAARAFLQKLVQTRSD